MSLQNIYFLFQDQHSESFTDLRAQREYHDLAAALSKSLQSLVQDETGQTEQPKNTKSNNGHRYENITYKKHLLKRHKGTEATDKSKRSKGTYAKNKFEKEQFQKSKDREYVFVRNHTQNSPSLRAKNEKIDDAYKKVQKSEFFILEKSGIYQIDLSSVRNEIPPVAHEPLPPLSAQTERSYRSRKQQRSSKYGRKKVIDKKWRDDCDCLRCDIIRRQFAEGDFESYKNWGNYPCMKLSKSRASSDMFYDSD